MGAGRGGVQYGTAHLAGKFSCATSYAEAARTCTDDEATELRRWFAATLEGGRAPSGWGTSAASDRFASAPAATFASCFCAAPASAWCEESTRSRTAGAPTAIARCAAPAPCTLAAPPRRTPPPQRRPLEKRRRLSTTAFAPPRRRRVRRASKASLLTLADLQRGAAARNRRRRAERPGYRRHAEDRERSPSSPRPRRH